MGGGVVAMHPTPPAIQFDLYTPVIVVPQMSGLCRAQFCPTSNFEGLYYWVLLLRALQSPACHHCLICTSIWSFSVPLLGLGKSRTMQSPCFDLYTHLHTFVL